MSHPVRIETVELGPNSLGAKRLYRLMRPLPATIVVVAGFFALIAVDRSYPGNGNTWFSLLLCLALVLYFYPMVRTGSAGRALRSDKTITRIRSDLSAWRAKGIDPRLRYLRTGTLVALAAYNLALMLVIWIVWTWHPSPTLVEQTIRNVAVLAIVASWGWGIEWITRRAQPRAEEIQDAYLESPIVYFRSFSDDNLRHVIFRWWWWPTFERYALEQVKRFGPLVAIGAPGDSGSMAVAAARTYVRDGNWQDVASRMLLDAQMIIVMAGETPGLEWEIERCAALGQIEKLIVLCPPVERESRLKRWRVVLEKLPGLASGDAPYGDFDRAIAGYLEPGGTLVVLNAPEADLKPRNRLYHDAIDIAVHGILSRRQARAYRDKFSSFTEGETSEAGETDTGGGARPRLDEEMLRALLEPLRDAEQVYVYPNIPAKQLANAVANSDVPAGERVYALFDGTAFRSAKENVVLTRSGLYYHDIRAEPEKGHVPLGEIAAAPETIDPARLTIGTRKLDLVRGNDEALRSFLAALRQELQAKSRAS